MGVMGVGFLAGVWAGAEVCENICIREIANNIRIVKNANLFIIVLLSFNQLYLYAFNALRLLL
jgi:hypothetical protein